jgi:hypothetical protein
MVETFDYEREGNGYPEENEEYKQKVRKFNDTFRQTGEGGRIVVTQGVQTFVEENGGQRALRDILIMVRRFNHLLSKGCDFDENYLSF